MYRKLGRGNKKGFTLLELLIVIAIIAILSVILIIVLDPAETLRKSRDAQRIADLNTLKTSLGIWTTTTSTPYLGGATSAVNVGCKTGTNATGTYVAGVSKIFYSTTNANQAITQTLTLDGVAPATPSSSQATAAAQILTDGTGWIPVPFDTLTGGSPISNEPLDPTNTGAATPSNADLNYRYVCNASTTKWQVDTVLESTSYNSKMSTDGGVNNSYYEVGTNLRQLGNVTTF